VEPFRALKGCGAGPWWWTPHIGAIDIAPWGIVTLTGAAVACLTGWA